VATAGKFGHVGAVAAAHVDHPGTPGRAESGQRPVQHGRRQIGARLLERVDGLAGGKIAVVVVLLLPEVSAVSPHVTYFGRHDAGAA
jgi:hypothetical protein